MFARIHQKMELSRQRREKLNISASLRLAVDENDLDKVIVIIKAHGNDPSIMNTYEGDNLVIGSKGCWVRPPLCNAVAKGDVAMVRALLGLTGREFTTAGSVTTTLDETGRAVSMVSAAIFSVSASLTRWRFSKSRFASK